MRGRTRRPGADPVCGIRPGRVRAGVVVIAAVVATAGCAGDDGDVLTELDGRGAQVLTERWGCGEGFYLSDEDQRVALFVSQTDMTDPVPREGAVGDAWRVELRTGSHLMANWCDDVIEADEPRADVSRRLAGRRGTVTITSDLPADPSCPTDVTAELSDLVVDGPRGTTIELGDLALHNDWWGCHPG